MPGADDYWPRQSLFHRGSGLMPAADGLSIRASCLIAELGRFSSTTLFTRRLRPLAQDCRLPGRHLFIFADIGALLLACRDYYFRRGVSPPASMFRCRRRFIFGRFLYAADYFFAISYFFTFAISFRPGIIDYGKRDYRPLHYFISSAGMISDEMPLLPGLRCFR